VYRLLSLCFHEPEPETLQLLINLRDQLRNHFPEYLEPAEQLIELFAATESTSIDRKVEYARLFITSINRTVPPYGSVYLEEGRKLLGESTAAVQEFYSRYNLQLEVRDAPDHIAVELEFMHYLACSAPEDPALPAALAEFTQRFVAPWMQPFATAVQQAGTSPFYTHLARLTADFVLAAGPADEQ
jgi:putative dimethyl sulfoxide reductase chaperone